MKDIEQRIRTAKDDVHFPRTKLVCLENTHNRMGGKVLTVEYTQKCCRTLQTIWIEITYGWSEIDECSGGIKY